MSTTFRYKLFMVRAQRRATIARAQGDRRIPKSRASRVAGDPLRLSLLPMWMRRAEDAKKKGMPIEIKKDRLAEYGTISP